MSGFTEAARRMAGVAAILCGWRPRDFWAATPQELADVLTAMADPVGAGGQAVIPMATADMADLMERFPDGRGD
jgi:hypothetical protein